MKYDERASYCCECRKPCNEILVTDGDGFRKWGRWVSDCCHEDAITRREAMDDYLWIRRKRTTAGQLHEAAEGLIEGIRGLR